MNRKNKWNRIQRRLFKMVSVGVVDDPINQSYDVISTGALIINLLVAVMNTFDSLHESYGNYFAAIEGVTVFLFAVDFILRVLTAHCLYPGNSRKKAILLYLGSFSGIVDLLSFLPYYLPFFFPGGVVAFRMIRVVRIFRLFRINAYYDSLNIITEVIRGKRQQLLSSVFIIAMLMLASSLCMYSLEHAAQPEVFSNAFSGIWWSASTLLTVGYGDIYPVTIGGQMMAIIIAFLGVGVVAIPTGIISAGFVEYYQKIKRLSEYGIEEDIHFITVLLTKQDAWVGKRIDELGLPGRVIIAAVKRKSETLIPWGQLMLQAGDRLIIGAEALKREAPVCIKEVVLKKNHHWNGMAIKDLDISRQSYIILVKRHGKSIIPEGNLILYEGDKIFLYSKTKPFLETQE